MASIGIIITQSGVSGGAGQSREDLVLGIPVILSNVSSSGVTGYKWEIIGKPYASIVTLSSSTGATSTFTPDITGSYLIQLTINGKLKERVVAAILTSRYELRIPAAGEGEEIAGGSFKAITEGIRTLESEGSNASSIQGEPVSTSDPGLNDLLRYNGSQWLPSGKVRTDDIGFRNNQDILIKIPLSAAIPANSYWQYDAGTSSAKPCWKTVTSGGVKPVLDFSWNVFPHGSVLKKLCIVAACNNTISNQLTITVDKTGAIWSANQITSFIEQFLSTTQHTVSSTVSSVLEVSANTTFTHGNGVDVPVASEGLSVRLTADGVRTFQIFAVYAYFQTLAIGLYNGPLVAEGGGSGGGGDSGGGSSGCCPFNIIVVNDATYSVDADGYNTMYVSNKPMADDNVIFSLPKSVDAGEGANFEFLVIGNYNPVVDGKFVLKTDATDTDGITWIGGSHTAINLVSDQSYSKIRMIADGVVGWYAESGEGLWGSATRDVYLHWPYIDKFLYTANVVGSVEDNITTFDAYGNIQDSGVSIGSVGGVTTASNYGIGGVGVYNDRNVNDLRFRNINVGSNKLTVTLDNANHEVDLDVDESNIEHQNLSGAGHYTHTVIDNHMDSYSNPHVVTQTQVGLGRVDNFRQVHGASSVTPGDIVEWGADGYHVADSGVAIDDLQSALTFIDSVQEVTGNVNLVGDAASPSANNFYGMTRGITPTRGWHTRNIAQRVTVGQAGSDVDYNSIKDAVDYVTTQSPSVLSQWEIIVYPGVYIEDPMAIIAGINVISHEQRINTVFVEAAHSNQDLFTMTGGYVCGLTAYGVTNASNCVFRAATPGFSVLHGVSFFNCSSGVIASGGAVVIMTNASILISGPLQAITNTAITATGVGSYVAVSGMFASVPVAIASAYYPTSNAIEKVIKAISGGEIYVSSGVVRVTSNGAINSDAIFADDGGKVLLCSVDISGCGNALHIGSVGVNSEIITQGANLQGNKNNIVNISSSGKVFASHTSDVAGYTGLSGTQLSGVVQYQNDALVKFIGNVEYQYLVTSEDVAFDRFFSEYTSTGVSVGGFVSEGSGLHVNVTEGYGWIRRGADSYDSFDVSWDPHSGLDLVAGAGATAPFTTNYVIYNSSSGDIENTTSVPSYGSNIILATVITDNTGIRYLHRTRNYLTAPMEQIRDYLLATRKVMLNSGLLVTSDITPPETKFSISSGSYYVGLDLISGITQKIDARFDYFYGTGGVGCTEGATDVDITNFDDSGTLNPLTLDAYRVDTVVVTSDDRTSVIYGIASITAIDDAELVARDAIIPSFMGHTAFPIAALIVWQGRGIVEIIDLRYPESGAGAGGGGGTKDHNSLFNLDVRDVHTQYLPVAGGSSRGMSGPLYMNNNNIVTGATGLVDGVDVSNHQGRHVPGSGTDPLPTAAGTTLVVGASAAEGGDANFSRGDHEHALPIGVPVAIGTPASAGDSGYFVHSNHVHTHGDQLGGSLHAVAISGGANGFMSGADKALVHNKMTLNASATTGGLSLGTSTLDQEISFQAADGTHNGYLSSSNWVTFNGKMTDPMTTRGDMVFRNSSNVTSRLPVGTVAAQVVRSDGTDVAWSFLEKIAMLNTSAEVYDINDSTGSYFRVVVDGSEYVRTNYAGNTGFGTTLASGTTGRVTSQGTTDTNATATFVGRNLSTTATYVVTSNGEARALSLSIGNTAINTGSTTVADFITDGSTFEKEIFIGPTINSRGEGITIGQSVTATGNYMLIGKNIHGGTTVSNYRTVYGNGSAYGYLGIEFMPNGIMRFLASNAITVGGATTSPTEFMRVDGGTNSSLMIGTSSYTGAGGDVGGKVVIQASSTNVIVGRDSSQNNIFAVSYGGLLTLGKTGVSGGAISLVSSSAGGYAVSLTVPSLSGSWVMRLPSDAGSSGQFLQTNGSGVTSWATASGGVTAYDLSTGSNISLSASGTGVLLTRNIQVSLSYTNLSLGTNLSFSVGSGVGILVGSTPATIAISSIPTFSSVYLSAASSQLVFNSTGVTGTFSWTPTGSNWVLTLPATPPSISGYLLSSNTSGTTSWVDPGSFTVPLLTASNGVTRYTNDFRNDLITGKVGSQTVYGGTVAGEHLTITSTVSATKGYIRLGISAYPIYYNENTNILGIQNINPVGAPLVVGTAGYSAGSIRIEGGTAGYVTIQTAATAGSYTFTLPASAGTSGYYLKSQGAGVAPIWDVMAEADTLASVTSRGTYTNYTISFNNTINVGSGPSGLGVTGVLTLVGGTSGYVNLTCLASTGTWTFIVPTSVGTTGYVLKASVSGSTNTTTWGQVNTSELATSVLSGNIFTSTGTGISSISVVPVANGGTGVSTFNVGAGVIISASGGTNALSKLSTLTVPYGGTGVATLASGELLVGAGAGNITTVPNTMNHDIAVGNVFVSSTALGAVHGNGNTAIGAYSLPVTNNVSAAYNTAVGNYSLYVLQGGSGNTAIGTNAGKGIIGGSDNVIIGHDAAITIANVSNVVAIGAQAGKNNLSGTEITFVGYLSGLWCTGASNTGIGSASLTGSCIAASNITNCTGIGTNALCNALTGASYNTAVGSFALSNALTGANNIGIGFDAGRNITSGTDNIAIGYSSMNGTPVVSIVGIGNIAIGSSTMTNLSAVGNYNVSIGLYSMRFCTVGASGRCPTSNTAVGTNALYSIVGAIAVDSTQSTNNVAVGTNAGNTLTIGWSNVCIGTSANCNNVATNDGTAVGNSAIAYTTSVAIGSGANAGGISGIAIGANVTAGANTCRIGYSAMTYHIYAAGWINDSDARIKREIENSNLGLKFINKLRPVSYKTKKVEDRWNSEDGKRPHYGFIAQEVKKVIDELGVDFGGYVDPKINNPDTKEYIGLGYNEFIAPMVKAIQEQQAMIETLKAEIELLKKKFS